MEQVREIKKSFCLLSVAYLIIGIVLLLWPDLSVRTLCYVFGVGILIVGSAYLIIYFTKDPLRSVMQPDLVIGVVGIASGMFILLKMQYMLELLPFVLGVTALLGMVVKIQQALDLHRIHAKLWYLMLVFALALGVLGGLLVANPFEGLNMIVILIGASLIVDGVGNLISIFWITLFVRHLRKVDQDTMRVREVLMNVPESYETHETVQEEEVFESEESDAELDKKDAMAEIIKKP
ncbi:MAG: DUF308 domain-containing protein [Eubacteriales bacterium]|nr:DUF308 domain-containing protein [Eubacteriales bacterium]